MTILQRYQLMAWVELFIIGLMIMRIGVLLERLRKKDMDKKIDHGRKTQKRMEEHPKRIGGPE